MRSITGRRRETRVRGWGDARGDPQKQHLSGFGRRLTPCLPGKLCSNGEIYLLRRRGRRNQAGGLRIRLRMAMARAHLAPFLTTSHRRRCRHSEVLTPVRKSKNGGSPKLGDFRGWVENPRIPGVGRCLDRGLQMPRGDKPLWLGANNPTPGLRKTLTAPASRRG